MEGVVGQDWSGELDFVKGFVAELELRMPLPEASATELSRHADQVGRLQDLMALMAALPPASRPPVATWDDALSPLWRLLFRKGDDISRYILADLWRDVLREAGEADRFVYATVSVAGSARNFLLFDEALAACREAREVVGESPSASLAVALNVEGIVQRCRHDYDAAEGLFRRMMEVLEEVPEEDLLERPGIGRADLLAAQTLNIADCYLQRAHGASGSARTRHIDKARHFLETFDAMPSGDGVGKVGEPTLAELLVLEGRFKEARASLVAGYDMEAEDGPFQYAVSPMQLRILSLAASEQGEWHEAYRWIRMALKQVTRKCYPTEEQFILEQALKVIRGFQSQADTNSREMIVQDLAQLLEDKDWYTGRSHSRDVAAMAVNLGQVLNSRGWSLDLPRLRYAGLLHDLGKLSIPWSLLNKIAPIAKREWALLEEHPARGAQMLRKLGMDDIAAPVEMHHEHVDGSGYPAGAPPDAHAAVIATCDVYEATITANRRYKDPKSPEVALAELRTWAGVKYHPEVVEALAHALRSGAAD
jgi:response regulator RpfG family c-di-GMP phosphodiesterase